MKRLFLLLLTVCLCCAVAPTLAACEKEEEEHQHLYKAQWSTTADQHWRECADEGCTEVVGKASHVWNDGEVTTYPTADTDGEKTFTCLVCGMTKVVPIVAA